MKISDRVIKRREELGFSQQDLADYLNISQPSIAKLETGLIKNPKHLKELAKLLQTTPEWLQFGIGEPIINDNSYIPILEWNEVLNRRDSFIINKKDKETIPMIGIGGERCYALKIKGDSMISSIPGRPTFLENNIIIIDPERDAIHGNFVIAKQKNALEPLFKQYIIDGNNSYLKPLNPQYPLIPLNEDIEIYGVVIAHIEFLV